MITNEFVIETKDGIYCSQFFSSEGVSSAINTNRITQNIDADYSDMVNKNVVGHDERRITVNQKFYLNTGYDIIPVQRIQSVYKNNASGLEYLDEIYYNLNTGDILPEAFINAMFAI